jgi:hypothetical protein
MGDSFDGSITDCVALNPSVKSTDIIYIGRVAGFKTIHSILSNNAAWDGILNNDDSPVWNNIGADKIDGEDMNVIFINTNGTLGERFTSTNGWATENGMLPGFGEPVKMPEHLRLPDGFPIITTDNLPNGTVGTTYNQTLTANGDTPITWSLESGNLPAGLDLSQNGIISGTPTTAGTFNFTVKAVNSIGSNTKALAITIEKPVIPPTIITNNLPNGETKTEYNQTLTAEGDTPITWSLENGSLPNGLNLSQDGVISGTPTTVGTFSFTVKAVNNAGSDAKNLSITISNTYISDNSQQQALIVYPNPVAGVLKIVRSTTNKAQIEIYNSKGSIVRSFEIDDEDIEINVSSLPSGIYLIRLTTNSGQKFSTTTQRFIKE